MIVATVTELRNAAGARLPESVTDEALDGLVDRASSRIEGALWRTPHLVDDRAEHPTIRAALIDAAVETVLGLLVADRAEAHRVAGTIDRESILAGGGSIRAGTLTASGGSGSAGPGGAAGGWIGALPTLAWDALRRAGLVGGSVASW